VSVPVTILALALLALVLLVISAPLRAASREREHVTDEHTEERVPDDLNAQREAKYREIRDAELDFRTGKLSKEDYEAIDAQLRAEAIEILDRLRSS
jgi:flagellar biosynthesis/type III secretory pathway M-ring protein FliF/YscJ